MQSGYDQPWESAQPCPGQLCVFECTKGEVRLSSRYLHAREPSGFRHLVQTAIQQWESGLSWSTPGE